MNQKILINLAKAGIFAALLTPFMVDMDLYFPFVASKGLWFMACAQLAFFSWLILAWHWKNYRPDFKNPVIAAALFFLAVMSASAVFGADFSNSFWSTFERMGGVLMFCHLTAFLLAAVSVLNDRDWIMVFFASIGAAAIVGLRALFDQSSAARGGGFLGNDSFLGTYLLFNVFIALYLFWSQKNSGKRLEAKLAAAAFCLLAFCLLFQGTQLWAGVVSGNFTFPENILKDIFNSGARAAKISFLGGMVFLGILRLAVCKRAAARIAGIVILCAMIFGAAAGIFLAIIPKTAVYEKMVDNFSQGTVYGRVMVWETAWKGFLERPLLGWGPENFYLVFARHYNPCLGSSECGGAIWYDRAHNIVMDVLVETGLIGMAGYVLIFAAALFVLWKAYFAAKLEFPAAGIFTALLAAYFVQNLTVFDMPASYLMFFLCLGFIAHIHRSGQSEKKVCRCSSDLRFVAPVLIAGIICFCVFVLAPLSSAAGAIKASREPFLSPQKLDLYRAALDASPMGNDQLRLFFARQWQEVASNQENASKFGSEKMEEHFAFFTEMMEKSVGDSSFDFRARLELGRLYWQWGAFDRTKIAAAAAMFEQARKLSPRNQQTYWELAQIKIYEKDIAAAKDLARRALELYPANAQAQEIVKEIEKIAAGE
jgi:tetratricopeptide (TPR) repeat protein